jgi:glutamine amidotransferase
MCRHLAWIGAPRTLAQVVLDPPYGLLHQSYAPREQRHGTVNADGFGVGWYAPGERPEPARYRRGQPIWTDRSFASFAGVVRSGCVLAAVRSATHPFASDESGAAPFTAGRWLFSHNGALDDFAATAPDLRAHLPGAAAAAVEAPSDSALLWAMVRYRLEAGAAPGEALAGVVTDTLAVTGGRMNLLLTDGATVAATACGDTLYTCRSQDGPTPGVLVASEPSDDDGGWSAVPDHSVVVATADGTDVCTLHAPAQRPAPTGGAP